MKKLNQFGQRQSRLEEQIHIFKRVLKYVKPFKVEMGIAVFGAFLVSVINMLLPRGLQFFLDNYLIKQKQPFKLLSGLVCCMGWERLLRQFFSLFYQYLYALELKNA